VDPSTAPRQAVAQSLRKIQAAQGLFFLYPITLIPLIAGTKMRKNYTRQQVNQAQIQIDEFQEAVMIWFPVGFAFLELFLRIFPKITLPI
jgi:hypothetical protein